MDFLRGVRKRDTNEDLAPPRTAMVQRGRHVEAEVAAVLNEFATLREAANQATSERDHIRSEHEYAMKLVGDAKNHITRLQEEVADLKSRCTGYQLERDQATAEAAKFKSVLTSVRAMLDAHEVPKGKGEPIASDAEAPLITPPTLDEMVARINGR